MELSNIKGVGPKTLEHLNKLNIYSVDDLVRYYPYRYNIYTPSNLLNVSEEDTVCITGTIVTEPKFSYIKKNFNKLTFNFQTNNILTSVTIFNRLFLKQHLHVGSKITVIGKYNKIKNAFTASDIKLYYLTETKVEPVYHKVQGLTSSTLSKCIHDALDKVDIDEILPDYINNKYELLNAKESILEIHNPTNLDKVKKAKIKLKYEELFEFMFKINLIKFKNQIFDDFVIKDIKEDDLNRILNNIPFKLTNDQMNAINDIINDYKGIKRMNRLILGDVGSGKTFVSFVAMMLNKYSGYQSALLAPTEVLARQHFDNFTKLFKDAKVELLVGSLKQSEKNNILKRLSSGDIDILIGTHAMLEDKVEFNNIGLVVTDEQHRFGVNQRKSLQNKGNRVDVLYMSATPIPRTYALTIYGDMDISMIKEKPAGRKEIETIQFTFDNINNAISIIEDELKLNHQAYVVAPLIESEDDEDTELNDLKKIESTLNKYLKNKYSIGILHGKMKQIDKDKIMNEFKEGNINILLSTTVIEVGVDVKNATVMTVFNAERFGLATLHQLRGRVGRNELSSKCLLISDKATDRLNILCESNDGFYISERDFELRGSGDLFGIRQSGDMIFKIADIKTDYRILLQCKQDSEEFVKDNIENDFNDYKYYKKILEELMHND